MNKPKVVMTASFGWSRLFTLLGTTDQYTLRYKIELFALLNINEMKT